MNRPTLPQVACVIAAITLFATLSTGFGIPGLAIASLTTLAIIALPAPYAFAIGQLGVAVLAPSRIPDLLAMPTIWGAEAALVLLLWSDQFAERDRDTVPTTVALTLLIAVLVAVLVWETESLWLTASVLLALIVTLAYALHRYTIVFITEESTP